MITSRFGLAASLALVLSGCVVTSSSGSSGGDGGDDTGSPASTPASSTASTASGSDGGGGFGVGGNEDGGAGVGGDISSTSVGGAPPGTGGAGAGGAPACGTCAEAITDPYPEVCEGTSSDLLGALSDCSCTGACAEVCADSLCTNADASPDCQACVIDTVAGCGNEFQACSGDF